MPDYGYSTVFVLLPVLLAVLCPVSCDDEVFQRIFQTEETLRQNKAHEIYNQMNLHSNPCNDFYEYACGNWKREDTPLLKVQHQVNRDLQRLLEESPHRNDSTLARQAKDFYQSCIAAQAQHNQQQEFLSKFIQQFGGFPAVPGDKWSSHNIEYNWAQVGGRLKRHFGMDILIGIRVSYNYASVQENSIYLSEPTTFLPNKLCTKQGLSQADPTFNTVERIVSDQLRTWLALGKEESIRLASDIVSLEHELCGSMQGLEPWDAELHLFTANFTRKTLAEFGHIYGLDFQTYVTNVYDQTIFNPVYMAAPNYYRQLKRTLSARNSSQLANYIMYRAVATLTFPLNDSASQRPAYCLEKVKHLLPSALGELYAARYAIAETKSQILELYAQLQEAMKRSIRAEWLEEGSRRIAQRKLSMLQLTFPNYEQPFVLKLQIDRNNYWNNLKQILGELQRVRRQLEYSSPVPIDPVEAYEIRMHYRPVERRLEIGWAMLQPPEYNEHYGHALRYAREGTALAQHMITALDQLQRPTGLVEIDSWDPLTAWRYRNRTECFAHQVEDYLQRNSSETKLLINGSAALSVAFDAYLTWLGLQAPNNDFMRLRKETLPGLNYSNTALFFLAFAQQHCHPNNMEHNAPELWPELIYSVRHSRSWIRLAVNGPLSNLKDFAREFHCPTGSPMNPSKKCILY